MGLLKNSGPVGGWWRMPDNILAAFGHWPESYPTAALLGQFRPTWPTTYFESYRVNSMEYRYLEYSVFVRPSLPKPKMMLFYGAAEGYD